MGNSTFDPDDWNRHATKTAAAPVKSIMTKTRVVKNNDPHQFKVRESRDSLIHPITTPVITAVDVSASMDELSGVLIKKGIGTIMQMLIDTKPIPGPQLAVAAYSDVTNGDPSPIQMTQFESGMEIVEQMADIFLVNGGGGNRSESDTLVWYMAANRVSHDAFEKRGKKGYLFTIGDEEAPQVLTRSEVKEATGDAVETDFTSKQLVEQASRSWFVYHIVVKEGQHVRHGGLDRVMETWTKLLGQNVVILDKLADIGEVIGSIIRVNEGESVDDVIAGLSDSTALTVRNAVGNLAKTGSGSAVIGKATGVTTL